MTKPYRAAPADFRETYIRMGWDGIGEHYRTNYRCIARWIEECGGNDLRRERSQVSGVAAHPTQRSQRYAAARALDDGSSAKKSGVWLHVSGGAFRLLLGMVPIMKLEDRFAAEDRAGRRQPKALPVIHADLCGGWNDVEQRPLLMRRPATVEARFDECIEVIRAALIGGGMAVIRGDLVTTDAVLADRFLHQNLIGRPIEQARWLASAILNWTIMGPPAPAHGGNA